MKKPILLAHSEISRSNLSGFTLVEIMIVVSIVGLLASLAVPSFEHIKRNTENTHFMNSIRVFSGAMENFMLETGMLPGDGGSGNLHANMQDYIRINDFKVDPPIGGMWDIELNKSGVISAVGVHRPTASVTQLAQIDQLMDDGDIADGNLRFTAGDRFYWVLVD